MRRLTTTPIKIGIRANDLAHESETLKGAQGRGDLGGMLTWDQTALRSISGDDRPCAVQALSGRIAGTGFSPRGLWGIITMDEGAEGFWFHEGGEPLDRSRGFLYRNGRIVLRDDQYRRTVGGCGAGRMGVLPVCPAAIRPTIPARTRSGCTRRTRIASCRSPAKADDAILFVETLMHGGPAVDGQTPAALGDFAL